MDIPRLTNALDAVNRTSDNVYTSLTFCLTQALVGPVEHCYLPEGVNLIRAAAAATPSEAMAAQAKLKAKFGKDFNIPRFRTCVREAKESLTVPTETSLIEGQNGPKPLLANAITKLATVLDLAFDTFASKCIHQTPAPWGGDGPWSDLDDISAANYLQRAGISISSATSAEAAIFISNQKPYHPVRDYLTSLKWDGIPRLEQLFPYYFGCPDGVWVREVSRMWMISAVARIMRPGCIAKYMVVLEGQQDKGKSKGLRALVNGHLDGDRGVQWFRDNMPPIDHKDIGIYMQGVWIIEVAELSSVKRAEWENIKSFISSPRDSFRKSYGRHLADYPRQCVFAGTTNEDRWGGDQTGLTRFWPMRTGKIITDCDGPCILRDRDQLWAEARSMYDEGLPWWGDEEFDKLARAEQSDRSPEDPLRERVASALTVLIQYGADNVSVSEICEQLKFSERERGMYNSAIGRTLGSMGWERFQKRVDGVPVPRWKPPE